MTPATKHIEWATEAMKGGVYTPLFQLFRRPHSHWSRLVEYPWAAYHGNFMVGKWVLDAGGGGTDFGPVLAASGALVVNADLDLPPPPARDPKIRYVAADLKALPYPDGCFDKVVCLSVIEHTDDPMAVAKELWRVLAPKGRLVVTLDVASYARWNHTVDAAKAAELVGLFGLTVPPTPSDVLTMTFPEIERKPTDPWEVHLKVLCFWCDKP